MRNRIKTSKTFVGSVVTKKNTRKTSWFKLMLGIITQGWKTKASKYSKCSIERRLTIQNFKRRCPIQDWCWQAVNDEDCSTEGFNPEVKRNSGMKQHCETCFGDMPVFSLCSTILRWCIGTGESVMNSTFSEMRLQILTDEFPSPITLENLYFRRELILNQRLEVKECLVKISFVF
jgi:hypothetical protein